MNDDFNSPKALAAVFDLVTRINSFKDGHTNVNQLSKIHWAGLQSEIKIWVHEIFGLKTKMQLPAEKGQNWMVSCNCSSIFVPRRERKRTSQLLIKSGMDWQSVKIQLKDSKRVRAGAMSNYEFISYNFTNYEFTNYELQNYIYFEIVNSIFSLCFRTICSNNSRMPSYSSVV